MNRAATITSTVAIVLSLVGCASSRPVDGTSSVASLDAEPVDAPSAAPAFEVHEIAVAGDGRSVPIALAETDDQIALFMTEPTGLGRYAIDLDAGTATRSQTVALEHYTNVASYDRAHDRLWWIEAVDQQRVRQPSSDGDFPRGDLVVTHSSAVAHTRGLHETIHMCPAQVGAVGIRSGPLCDHQIRVLLPAFDGVVLGGHLAERVGQASAAPWLGFADQSGALTAERRLPDGMGEAWIDALAWSDAGVLAVAWSGRGEPARSSFLLFGGPTLEPIATAARTTPSWVATPWSAAVAAPDGSFWVALTTARHELTIISIARDGSITSDHAIDRAELPISSVQSLGVRGGQPWLMIASPNSTLSVSRIDPATGAVAERHELPLPTDFYPSQMLALDRGFVLAGRVGVERPLIVWARERESGDSCSEPIPDEVLAITGVIADLRFTDTYSGKIEPSSFAALERIAEILIRHPELQFEIRGHHDSETAEKYSGYGMKPTQREADSVRDFLISHGVPADRLVAKGYGDSMPLAPNDTAEGRALNHRVELVLVAPPTPPCATQPSG